MGGNATNRDGRLDHQGVRDQRSALQRSTGHSAAAAGLVIAVARLFDSDLPRTSSTRSASGDANGRRVGRGRGILLVAVVVGVVLWGVIAGSGASAGSKRGVAAASQRPNIVFLLTDDLAWNLVTSRFMPHVMQLERQGETFQHYVVADSLCCPSRTSIFTGLFPHDSGVFTNQGTDGGYYAFTHHKPDLETKTFAVATQRAGYLNSMMGKYLNGYGEPTMTTHIPPGWSDWHVGGNAYPEFNYDLNENGTVVHYGAGPPPAANAANYLTDVLAARATSFIDRAAMAHKPFVMEVATFAPHSPFTPAPRNGSDFPGLRAPRDPSFNTNNVNPPDWLGARKKLTPSRWRRSTRSSGCAPRRWRPSISCWARLRPSSPPGGRRNTYIVFSSDNGYHMGQHRLLPGKETAFDTDIRVPLIIAGPGVPSGPDRLEGGAEHRPLPDLCAALRAHAKSAVDGHSLVPLLHPRRGGPPLKWPTVALIDITDPATSATPISRTASWAAIQPLRGDPALEQAFGNVAVYVEYKRTGKREYYNIDKDPFERNNTYKRLSASRRSQLHRILLGLENCHGATACRAAADPQP